MTAEELKSKVPSPDAVLRDIYGVDWKNNSARCPFPQKHSHGDRDPSLRYDRNKQRVFCASQQCFGESGADAIGVVQSLDGTDFKDSMDKLAQHYGVSNGNTTSQAAQRPRTASEVRAGFERDGWNVHSEGSFGDSLRQVRLEHQSRLQPGKARPEKRFVWEHRTGEAWFSGAGGRTLPVYYNRAARELDQVEALLGVEGWGKADAAATLGIPAFSLKEVSEDNAEQFSSIGRITIWPDKDPTGAKLAASKAELLAKYTTVCLIDPPAQLPEAGDIIDAIALGWTAERIASLIAAANRMNAGQPVIRSIEDIPHVGDIKTAGISYLIEPELPLAAVIALTGDSGSGKSTQATAWIRAAIEAGHPVLVLDRENPHCIVDDRKTRLGLPDGPLLRWWGGWLPEEAPAADSRIVLEWVRNVEPKPVVIIDSVVAFFGGESENDAAAMRKFMHGPRRLADLGASVILIHHDGKADSARDFRGSSDFKAAVDVAFHVTNSSPDGKLDTLRLRCFKSRFGFSGDLVYRYAGGRMLRDNATSAPARAFGDELTALLRQNPAITARDFEGKAVRQGLGRNRSRDFLNDGVLSGVIRRETGANGAQHHYLAEVQK